MKIEDLSYLENITANDGIAGGALVEVDAFASAEGDSSLALTDVVTKARALPNGKAIAFGRGRAVAIGDNPIALVGVDGEGDKVIGRTKTKYFPNRDMTVARGFVIAIDHS